MKQINIDKIDKMTGAILGKKIIKSKTILGESAKQSFYLYKCDGYEATLVIHKLVLSDDEDMWKDFESLKTFKGKTLFFQHYSIKMSTLSQVIYWMNSIANPSKVLNEVEFLYSWIDNDYSQSIMEDENGLKHLSEADILNIMQEFAHQLPGMKQITDDQIEKMGDDYLTKVGSVDNRKDIRFDYIQGLKDMKELLENHKSNDLKPLDKITIEDPKGLLKVMSMEPYTPSGEKVAVTEDSINYGYDSDKEKANKLHKVGGIYTIDYTEVGGWHTDVYLKEFPGVYFNSVHFINVKD